MASLAAGTAPLTWDAWVIDNASSDDSVAAIRAGFPHVRLIANRGNVGFAAANNQGIAASRGRYVLLLNSDTVVPPGSLAALVGFADAHPGAGVVGPELTNPDGSYQTGPTPFPSVWNELLSASGVGRRLTHRGYPSRPAHRARLAQRTDYVGGACMLGRRTAVDEVGGLDESYFMYSEEPDWCWRMRRHGWEVWYTPSAKVIHYGGQSTSQAREAMIKALYRSKVRFLTRHRGRRHGLALAAGLVGISCGRRLIRRALRQSPPGVALGLAELLAEPSATGIPTNSRNKDRPLPD
ncbi:MAG: glycosyltransferase family 2 protein [Vicinamibacterales bacterium]